MRGEQGIAEVSMANYGATVRRKRSDLVTVGKAAEILSVHPDTLRRWGARGLLSVYRVGPRHDRRFHRSEVTRLLTNR